LFDAFEQTFGLMLFAGILLFHLQEFYFTMHCGLSI